MSFTGNAECGLGRFVTIGVTWCKLQIDIEMSYWDKTYLFYKKTKQQAPAVMHLESTNLNGKPTEQYATVTLSVYSCTTALFTFKLHSISQYKVKCTKDITSLVTHSGCCIKSLFISQSQSHAGISKSTVY